jgi:hypothetical protein
VVLSLSSLICGCLLFAAGQTVLGVIFSVICCTLFLLILAALLKKLHSQSSIAQARRLRIVPLQIFLSLSYIFLIFL